MQPLKGAGKQQGCRASQQDAGGDVDLQHSLICSSPSSGFPARKMRRNLLSGQGFSVGCHGCTGHSPCLPALIPLQMALKIRIQFSVMLLQQQLLSCVFRFPSMALSTAQLEVGLSQVQCPIWAWLEWLPKLDLSLDPVVFPNSLAFSPTSTLRSLCL